MTLPTGIITGDPGHIGHHNALHAFYNLLTAPRSTAGATPWSAGRVFKGSFDDRDTLVSSPLNGDIYIAEDIGRWYWYTTVGAPRWQAPDEDEGINVLDYGAKGDGSTDDYAAFIGAADYAVSSGICKVLIPSPPGDRYYIGSNIALQNYPFVVWEGIGSKKRTGTNQAGSQRTPTVPIFFANGCGFIATADQDINSSWGFKNLRIKSDVTAMKVIETFLLTLENVHLEVTSSTASADNAALVCVDTTLFRAIACSFTSGGRVTNKPSVIWRGRGTGSNIDVSTEAHFEDCYFISGGVHVEQQSAGTNYFPRKITMHHCIGESFADTAMLEFVAATAADPVVWTGVSMIDCSQSDNSGTAPAMRVGAYNTVQNFIVQGCVSTTSVRVLANGAIKAGLVIANEESPNFAAALIIDSGGAISGVQKVSATSTAGDLTFWGTIGTPGDFTLYESSAPSGVANAGRVFTRDNGSGKTQLCVIFGSGAVQVLSTEP